MNSKKFNKTWCCELIIHPNNFKILHNLQQKKESSLT